MSVRSSLLAAAAVAASLATLGVAAAPAVAAEATESVTVSYADLNLTNDAGRAVLDRRIASAAAQLCGDHRVLELRWANAVEACRDATIDSAQAQRDAAVRYGTVEVSEAAPLVRVTRAAN